MKQVFGSQWAKAGCWPSSGAVLCGSCWVLGSLLALKHNQIFALFVAVHPAVCGQDTLVRKSFLLQSLKTTFVQCSLVTHACPSLELGHLLFLMNLVVFSFDQLWISQSCCSPYHESQNQKQHPLSWREGCLSHPAYTAYFTETPWRLAALNVLLFLPCHKSLLSFTPEFF